MINTTEAECFNLQRGLFIVMEGIDGCGKTTQVRMLAERLNKMGKDVVVTREPGGTRIGEKIRDLLLSPENREITPRAETFLYAADRAQHVGGVILPALQKGKIVICDRFTDSTLAYQGGGRGIDIKLLSKINELATSGLYPDLVFILDVPPEIGMARLKDKAPVTDRLESENLSFYRRVRETYLVLAQSFSNCYRVIDGRLRPEEVHRQVWREVVELFGEWI